MKKKTRTQETNPTPCRLRASQEWFAGTITRRLSDHGMIQSYTEQGFLIAEEAARYMAPSPTMQPHQRMQIYNQQYWWRLLNTLHTNFPLVTRLFGCHAFNEKIGIPYLLHYPPNHWSLNVLGERLPNWVAEHYPEQDKSLVLNATHLDWAFTASYVAPQCSIPNLNELIKDPEKLLSQIFYLQPSINFFNWEYDLLTFRGSCLREDADYWVDHRFPRLPKEKSYFFILYRNLYNQIAWREISREEFTFLSLFKTGISFADACAHMESKENSMYEYVAKNLEKWLQEWIQGGLLTLKPHRET